VGSNRYEYWRVAFRSFADHPLAGLGTAGFQVAWLRQRPIRESARNAHSLYLETAAELGIAGVLALGLFLAGVGLAAREAMRRDPAAAVGLLGAVTVFGFHAGIDWDWQMPAVTLPALVAAAGLVALGEP
jgi:O-antigen ligase